MMDFSPYGDLSFLQNSIGGIVGILFILALIDTALKGWGMWRAARMNKLPWFIALLLFNTLGIFPGIFLLMTNAEYQKWVKREAKKNTQV